MSTGIADFPPPYPNLAQTFSKESTKVQKDTAEEPKDKPADNAGDPSSRGDPVQIDIAITAAAGSAEGQSAGSDGKGEKDRSQSDDTPRLSIVA